MQQAMKILSLSPQISNTLKLWGFIDISLFVKVSLLKTLIYQFYQSRIISSKKVLKTPPMYTFQFFFTDTILDAGQSSTASSRWRKTRARFPKTLPANARPATAKTRRSKATSGGSWTRGLTWRKTPARKLEASEAGLVLAHSCFGFYS